MRIVNLFQIGEDLIALADDGSLYRVEMRHRRSGDYLYPESYVLAKLILEGVHETTSSLSLDRSI